MRPFGERGGGNTCHQECPAVLCLPRPQLSQAAASARLRGERRWEEGWQGETESFLWQRIHLSQLINLTFMPSFSCKAPERFGDLCVQSMGQRPPLCAQPRGAGLERPFCLSAGSQGRGKDVAGARQGAAPGAAELSLVAVSTPPTPVFFGVLLWLGRNGIEPKVVRVAQECSFLRSGR